MNLKPEELQENWNVLLDYINTHITGDRKDKLIEFYNKFEERLILMPASHKKEFHNAFPGGYVEHVNRVVRCSLKQYELWKEEGVDITTFTVEELVFSAINHDLGKMGSEEHESYIPQTDKWRRDKLGEDYMHNKSIAFSSIPDRGLFLLQSNGIQYTFNEMIAIQTHDGLYDEANKKYLFSYMPETKPRTSLPFILHQADLMAARIEFEREWLPRLNGENSVDDAKKVFTLDNNNKKSQSTSSKALKSVQSQGLKNLLDNI